MRVKIIFQMLHQKQLFFQKYWQECVLIGIILLGIWLRFEHLTAWTWGMASGDEGRDMLTAHHIVHYGEVITRGPLAAGGFGILANSPFYFYFLSLIWFFASTPETFMIVWAILMTCMIPLGYLIGARLWDKTAGIFIATIFAVHPTIVTMSKEVSQPNLIPLWLLVVLSLFIGRKIQSVFKIFFLIFLLILGVHIHYQAALIIPGILAWICWSWYVQKPNVHRVIFWVFPILAIEYATLLWIYFSYRTSPFDQLFFVQADVQNMYHVSWQKFLSVLSDLGHIYLPTIDDRGGMVIILIIAIILVYQAGIKTKEFHMQTSYRWGFVCLLSSLILAAFYSGRVQYYYLYSILSLYLVYTGVVMRQLFQSNRLIGFFVFVFYSMSLLGYTHSIMQPQQPQSFYFYSKGVAQAIASDYESMNDRKASNQAPSFVIAALSTSPYLVYDAWGTGGVWYWLEALMHQKLVTSDKSVTNFSPLARNPRYYYVICDHRDSPGKAYICFDRFVKNRAYISIQSKQIYDTDIYSVRRFDIIHLGNDIEYYHAYPELMDGLN